MQKNLGLVRLIDEASQNIAPYVRQTYLEHSTAYSELTGARVFLKCENLQYTGSFKLRGAINKLLSVDRRSPQEKVVVAASTGNHGKAVAHGATRLGFRAKVFAPSTADPEKLHAIERYGAELVVGGNDCIDAEVAAQHFSDEHDAIYVSPYNDPIVVAGQGVIGKELCGQMDRIDAVFVSLGGGGLVSGIAAAVKNVHPDCKVIACSPENSMVMIESLQAGKIVDLPSEETLSDGTAGGVEAGSVTFNYCRELVDECVSVSEDSIKQCLRDFITTQHMLIEGAAAVAIAGMMQMAERWQGKNVVVVLCGANIGATKLSQVFNDS